MNDDPGEPHLEAERSTRPSEPMLNLPSEITAALSLLFAIQAIISITYYFVPDSVLINQIFFYGGFIPLRYDFISSDGDLSWLWSPLTYSLLHGGWEHLIFNGIWLAVFGSPVARRIGTARFVCFWIFLSVASAFLFYVFNSSSDGLLVGASGVISGLTGAACRFVWSPRRALQGAGQENNLLSFTEALTNRSVLAFAVFWFVANVVFAAFAGAGGQAIAWEAHLGGFVAGFLLFRFFDRPGLT